jgi:hypothetical protein
MEPFSVGVVVAALIAKALNRAEEGVVDGAAKAAGRALEALKRRFSDDPGAEQALQRLAEEPGNELREQSLAALLEERAAGSVELREELKKIAEQIEGAGVTIGDIEQSIEGDGGVQNAGIVDSQININQAKPPPSVD